MAFGNSTGDISIQPVNGGEVWENNFFITTSKFSQGIKTNKFASYNNGVLGTGITGTLAGVVVRDITGSLEVGADDDVHPHTQHVTFVRAGVVSVDVLTGNTPAFGGLVYTDNDGKATTNNAKTLTNAEFIREIKTGVWLIRLI